MKPEQLKTESIRQMILRSYAAPVANRGLSYAANNRVINIGYLAAERLIHAKVSGSMLDPYLAEVRLNFQGALEETYCTCPVRHYCKHTAALLWTVVAHFSRGGNLSDLHKFSMLQMPGYLAQAARDVVGEIRADGDLDAGHHIAQRFAARTGQSIHPRDHARCRAAVVRRVGARTAIELV